MIADDIRILRERTASPVDQFNAAERAGYDGSPEAIAVLVDVLRTHPSAIVREGAANGLSQTEDADALAALAVAAEYDVSNSVRITAKDALDRG